MSSVERDSELNRNKMKVEEALQDSDPNKREKAASRHIQIQWSLDNAKQKSDLQKNSDQRGQCRW